MADAETPKLKVKDNGQDIFKGYAEKSADLKREYDDIQDMYVKLNAKLNQLKSSRWLGLRGPELDKDAAPLVMSNLEKRLDQLFQDFRNKIRESEENRETNIDLANTNVQVAFSEFKSGMNQIISGMLDEWVAAAKNPNSGQSKVALSENMENTMDGDKRDDRIKKATR